MTFLIAGQLTTSELMPTAVYNLVHHDVQQIAGATAGVPSNQLVEARRKPQRPR